MFHDIDDLKFKNSKLIYEYILKLKRKKKLTKLEFLFMKLMN